MARLVSWVAAAAIAISPSLATGDESRQVLSLARAIELALANQPSLRSARAQVEAARARVDQARVARYPTATASASGAVGSAPKDFFSATAATGIAVQANWRIYDFGQTRESVRAAELAAAASSISIDTAALDIRTAVELAYLEAIARSRLIEVAESTARSEEAHFDQAKKFVAAGAKDPIEVVQAEARAANARAALAQARSAEAIALANLGAAIGWLDATQAPAVERTWPTHGDDLPALATLVDEAQRNRPELAQLAGEVVAAEASAVAAEYGNRPVVSATAQTQWAPGDADWTPEPSWTAGINLTWQWFDGGRTRAAARLARASVASARAERDALVVQLTAQLAAARSQIIADRAAVAASQQAVAASRAQLKLADGRYAQGLGSQIELADAQAAVTAAEGNLVQSEWQLADAWARLRRATGRP